MSGQSSGGNVIAALCNIFIPGLGQLVQGRLMAAILFFVGWLVAGALVWVLVGWVLLPIVYLWAIIDAARFRSSG